jgi:twitching motility protein PilU
VAGKISYEDALNSADSRNEVRLMIKLGTQTGDFGNDDMILTETEN